MAKDQKFNITDDVIENSPLSLGNTVFIEIVSVLLSDSYFNYDTCIINISTILRNCHETDIKETDWFVKFIKEYLIIRDRVIDAYKNNSSGLKKKIFIPYLFDYQVAIPPVSKRNLTPYKQKFYNVLKKIFREKEIFKHEKFEDMSGNVVLYEPMKEIQAKPIKRLSSKLYQKRSRNVLMVSHCPMDFYIMKNFNVDIVESYTGELKKMTPLAMGQKTFKMDIPFYPATHALLGDKFYIKPSIKKSEKQKLLKFLGSSKFNLHAFASNFSAAKTLRLYGYNVPFDEL